MLILTKKFTVTVITFDITPNKDTLNPYYNSNRQENLSLRNLGIFAKMVFQVSAQSGPVLTRQPDLLWWS
jgi:hypothetical protein